MLLVTAGRRKWKGMLFHLMNGFKQIGSAHIDTAVRQMQCALVEGIWLAKGLNGGVHFHFGHAQGRS
jgi:hypothetical protein